MTFPGVDPRQPITLDRAIQCPHPRRSPATDQDVLRHSLSMLEQRNIWAITSGPLDLVTRWRDAAPERVIPAVSFLRESATVAQMRELVSSGRVAVFAEIGAQYRGLRLDDEVLEPFFALAEELDVPVGVHLGEGPPGGPHVGPPAYRAALTSPLQLEPVLMRHPKLRIWVMHYGSPLVDEMIALLYSHPQVYVDIAQNNWGFPRAHFYAQLKRLVDAGFARRIMWGSDQMVWPHTIEVAIDTIERAPILDEKQKRDILYWNAVRFFRFTRADVERHHRG